MLLHHAILGAVRWRACARYAVPAASADCHTHSIGDAVTGCHSFCDAATDFHSIGDAAADGELGACPVAAGGILAWANGAGTVPWPRPRRPAAYHVAQ